LGGATHFNYREKSLIVAGTAFDASNDRKSPNHYSALRGKGGLYGTKGLYADNNRANEELQFIVAAA
jgi:hypothetical protein